MVGLGVASLCVCRPLLSSEATERARVAMGARSDARRGTRAAEPPCANDGGTRIALLRLMKNAHLIAAVMLIAACGGESSDETTTQDAGTGAAGSAGAPVTGGAAGSAGSTSGAGGLAGSAGVAGASGSGATGGKPWKPDPNLTGNLSCEGRCGNGATAGGCRCDAACESEGGCCADYINWCAGRSAEPSGACVKNSDDQCQLDADCKVGGCASNLCYNPGLSDGISNCFCSPQNVSCGCVSGKCTWY